MDSQAGRLDQRAREIVAQQLHYIEGNKLRAGDCEATNSRYGFAIRCAAAALREQPEARGVVDGAVAGLRVLRTILAKENLAGVDVADQLIADLTAAQQPVQEGGGEVTPYGVARASSSGVAALLARNGVLESANRNMRFMAAPPSAPVGALKDAALIAGWEAKANAIEREEASRRSDIDFGKVLQLRECAQELRSRAEAAALAQQPAQAAPGDGAHCATCTCHPGMTPAVRYDLTPAQHEGVIRDHLISLGWTPPDDDAAGGGHG